MITGADLKRLRERNNWSQSDLANAINAVMDTSYGSGSISPWERGSRNIPANVARFIEGLMIETNLPPDDEPRRDGEPGAVESDAAPGPGGVPPAPQSPLTSGDRSAYTRACEELWELIGGGIGMIGGATGNVALVNDGAIIVGDKQALGAAWGKLAETNETFRKMLVGMTEGGAWLQVAIVTGTTVTKCYSANHAPQFMPPPTAAQVASNGHADVASA